MFGTSALFPAGKSQRKTLLLCLIFFVLLAVEPEGANLHFLTLPDEDLGVVMISNSNGNYLKDSRRARTFLAGIK